MSSDLTFYADGDSVTFRMDLTDEHGDLVNADSATISVRRARSTQYKDFSGATEVLASTAFESLGLGSYRYSWSTAGLTAGKYVAQASVVRGGVTNVERLLVPLR